MAPNAVKCDHSHNDPRRSRARSLIAIFVGAALLLVGVALYRASRDTPVPAQAKRANAASDEGSARGSDKMAASDLYDRPERAADTVSLDERTRKYRRLVTLVRELAGVRALLRNGDGKQEPRFKALGTEIIALIESLGGKEILYDLLDPDNEPEARAMALRALLSFQTMSRLTPSSLTSPGYSSATFLKDERLIQLVRDTAIDPAQHPEMRAAAIRGIPLLGTRLAEPLLETLLAERGDLLVKAFAVTETLMDFDEAERAKPTKQQVAEQLLSDRFKGIVKQVAGEIAFDRDRNDGERVDAVRLLSTDPEWVFRVIEEGNNGLPQIAHHHVIAAAGRWLQNNTQHAKVPSVVMKLMDLASHDVDPYARQHSIYTLGHESLRSDFGDLIEKTLLSIAVGQRDPKERVVAIRSLARAKYQGASRVLRQLATDAPPEVVSAAQEALTQLAE